MYKRHNSMSAVNSGYLPVVSPEKDQFLIRKPKRVGGISFVNVSIIFVVAAIGSAGITAFVLNSHYTELQMQAKEYNKRIIEDLDIAKDRELSAYDDVNSCEKGAKDVKYRLDKAETHLEEAHTRIESDNEAASRMISELEQLQTDLSALNQSEKVSENSNIIVKLKEEAEGFEQKLNFMQKQIGVISKREVLRRFGEGPHQVKIVLDFPPEPSLTAPDGSTPSVIVLEMAPLDLMPHSVYLFLSMVEAGLWDGTSFVRKADHVLLAAPQSYYKNKGADVHRKFLEMELEKVAFQEYSEEYSHKAYTVGFSGRPGGPDFYFNRIDNSFSHGPGRREKYGVTREADPCFARVVHGFGALERIAMMPTLLTNKSEMEHYVGMEGVYILPKNELVQTD